MEKKVLCFVIFVSLVGLISCFQSIESYQAKSMNIKHGAGGGHGAHGGGHGGMGGHSMHGGGSGGMGGHHMDRAASSRSGFRSKSTVGARRPGKETTLADFTERDAHAARESSRRSHASHELRDDDAIALNARMMPDTDDVQFLDTKNGRLFGKDAELKEFVREQENRRQPANRGALVMNPERSEKDLCDLVVTNATFASNKSCTCEHVNKSICVFGKSEPRPSPGSKVMYEGCYKANMPGIVDPEHVCQAARYCEEKKCDAIYHDGTQFVYIKCYYGSLPVKKTSNEKQRIFTLSKNC